MIELECGVTVYPAREEQGRWRAVWYENGKRQQCEAASEEKLAAKLEKNPVLMTDPKAMLRALADVTVEDDQPVQPQRRGITADGP